MSLRRNIILIRPSYSGVYTYYADTRLQDRQINPPLGLLYLASYLRQEGGYDVCLLDAEAWLLSPERVAERVQDMDAALVGITATTAEIIEAGTIAVLCKRCMPGVPVIIGGSHASALPRETLEEFPAFDIVVCGEGERALKEIADSVIAKKKKPSQIEGIWYRSEDGSIVSTGAGAVQDFDALPMPAWDLVDMHRYLYPMGRSGMQRSAMVQTVRGCPYRCIFCFQESARKVRFRSPEKILEEIRYLKEKKGVECINFVDDTFMTNTKHLTELLTGLIASRMNIRFKCMTRADTVSKELIELAREAGCVRLSMGVESGNEEILRRVNKGTTKEMYRRAYRIINECGIECRGSFILGLPHETLETMADTIAFSRELDLYHAAFNIATPYPGTGLFACAEQRDGYRFLSEGWSWSEFRRWGNAVAAPVGFSKEDMLALQRFAHAEFYSQPKIIAYYLDLMKTLEGSYFYFRPFIDGLRSYCDLMRGSDPLYARLKKRLCGLAGDNERYEDAKSQYLHA
ncbi:MAG: radical SAM protein [Candidatus Omnitrophica bacterium]|nr:radical SAM protein [Candidatus Omnitrophota bacterium]